MSSSVSHWIPRVLPQAAALCAGIAAHGRPNIVALCQLLRQRDGPARAGAAATLHAMAADARQRLALQQSDAIGLLAGLATGGDSGGGGNGGEGCNEAAAAALGALAAIAEVDAACQWAMPGARSSACRFALQDSRLLWRLPRLLAAPAGDASGGSGDGSGVGSCQTVRQ